MTNAAIKGIVLSISLAAVGTVIGAVAVEKLKKKGVFAGDFGHEELDEGEIPSVSNDPIVRAYHAA